MSKGVWITIIVVLIISGIVVYNKVITPDSKVQAGPAGGAPKALTVNGFIAAPKNLDNNIFASGSLLANEEAELHPEVAGRITQLHIKEGVPVSKGALLVKLYDADLQASLEKLQAQKETAQKTEQRLKQLLSINGVGAQEYDNAVTQLRGIEADIDYTKAQITKTEIRAPFDGRIGLKNVSEGAYVSPSTVIANFQQVKILKIDFSVPEKYASTVRTGDPFNFKVDGYRDTFAGKIFAIEPKIDEATRTIKVRGIVENSKTTLFPGSFAKIDLGLKDIPNALMVPTQCVVPDARNKRVVLVKGGKAVYAKVETGIRNESYIQITDGIQAGDTLVATGIMYLKPDMDIKVSKIIE